MITTQARSDLYGQLAAALTAGASPPDALRALSHAPHDTIAQGLATHDIPALDRTIISVAESTELLPTYLRALAADSHSHARLDEQIRTWWLGVPIALGTALLCYLLTAGWFWPHFAPITGLPLRVPPPPEALLGPLYPYKQLLVVLLIALSGLGTWLVRRATPETWKLPGGQRAEEA